MSSKRKAAMETQDEVSSSFKTLLPRFNASQIIMDFTTVIRYPLPHGVSE